MPGMGTVMGGLGNRVLAEINIDTGVTREYIWLGDRIIAVAPSGASASTLYWVTTDHLTRPVQMTDSSKAVVWRAKYGPFGDLIETTGAMTLLDARFPGQWFQMENWLACNWHRHYDASIGRYVQPDPLGLVDEPSVYGYVWQNPLSYYDAEGLAGNINLGNGGFTGRLDTFNYNNASSFEMHLYDPAGRELGVYGPNGWINKHGGIPTNVPEGLENSVRGACIKYLRNSGLFPPKGTANIRGKPVRDFMPRGVSGGIGTGVAAGKQN